MVKYYIGTTEIQEPIGYDDFETEIKRHEYHGISVENSVGELEFYGNAFDIIQTAYQTDIDTELVFKCEVDDIEEYSGVIDLSTYQEQSGEYCSIKCKVAEIGVKTTFNNRIDTEVDLESLTSLDGVAMEYYNNLGRQVDVPYLPIKKTVTMLSDSESGEFSKTILNPTILNVAFPFNGIVIKELEGYSENVGFTESNAYFYKKIDDVSDFRIKLIAKFAIKTNTSITIESLSFNIFQSSNLSTPIYSIALDASLTTNYKNYIVTAEITDLSLNENEYFVAKIKATSNFTRPLTIKANEGSYLLVSANEQSVDTSTKMAMVHETLSRVTESISGISVKTDWYGTPRSEIFPTVNYGGGALKSLVLGYWLRQATNKDGSDYKLRISFKDIFSNLTAIDNIGWGFFVEDNTIVIRVENWKWFYKSDVLLIVDNPQKKTRKLRPTELNTRLKIGYAKYADVNELNSIDTFHTQSNYSTLLKSADKEIKQISNFIADPYAIEFTRRKALDKTTQDWKYDEDIFIFDLFYNSAIGFGIYGIATGVNCPDESLISPSYIINGSISPLRNALRWADRLFYKNDFNFAKHTKGFINENAKFSLISRSNHIKVNQDSANGDVYSENQNIPKITPLLKPEIIEFEYPICSTDYAAILANPYGTITVDGEDTFLSELKYKRSTGLATFKVIPKNI